MVLSEAQKKFIKSWGILGSQWGINKTMAQIHGLFIISDEPISAEEIMELLKFSRGNVNMNLRILIDWGLVYREHFSGQRKEFFVGEKDMWLIIRRVLKVRKAKELDPMIRFLADLKNIEKADGKSKEFIERVDSIEKFATQADSILDKIIKGEESWFMGKFIKLMT